MAYPHSDDSLGRRSEPRKLARLSPQYIDPILLGRSTTSLSTALRYVEKLIKAGRKVIVTPIDPPVATEIGVLRYRVEIEDRNCQ
jgi:hypothetical protein